MKRNEFHQEAEKELLAEADFYEAQTSGLGKRFLLAVNSAIERLKYDPAARPRFMYDIRGNQLRISNLTCCISMNRIESGLLPSHTTVEEPRIGESVSQAPGDDACYSTAIS